MTTTAVPTTPTEKDPAMTVWIATICLNLDTRYRDPYTAGDRLACVAWVEVNADTPDDALHAAWAIGNKARPDDTGEAYPANYRSLSVGDVVLLGADPGVALAYAVAGVGWIPLDLDATLADVVPDGLNAAIEAGHGRAA